MYTFITSLFVLILISILSLIEKKIWKTIYTPFVFLSIPFAIILILGMIDLSRSNLHMINEQVLIIWSLGLSIFWIPSPVIAFAVTKNRSIPFRGYDYSIKNGKIIFDTLLVIFLIVVLALIISMSSANLLSSNFKETLFYSSFISHLKIFVRVFFIFLLGSQFNFFGKTGKITLVLTMILIFSLEESKSWLLIPIATVTFLKFSRENKVNFLNIKYLLFVLFLIYSVFYIIYYFTVGNTLNFHDYNIFIINHIIDKFKDKFFEKGWAIEHLGYSPREEVFRKIKKSSGLLLLSASSSAIPGKLFEYIIFRKPIFVVTERESATWNICKKLPQAFLFDIESDNDDSNLEKFYMAITSKNFVGVAPDEYSEKYLSRVMLDSVENL